MFQELAFNDFTVEGIKELWREVRIYLLRQSGAFLEDFSGFL